MPRRTDISKILLIGSGPIVIGQACEFDYSGSQACKALRQEGFQVVLVNSNPATIMTDPDMADRTYIEPITKEAIEKIIQKEKPDACLPTMGGQTALNVACELEEAGIFEKYGVKLIGANYEAMRKAEDRELFKAAMTKIGLDMPISKFAYSVEEAVLVAEEIGYPVIVRPSFTMGGSGSGICYNRKELEQISQLGIEYSRVGEVLIEESVLGWKEYELEVMRDYKDNVVIICSIENLDPMGVHTGDSITVAPAQTLSDKEYQRMRDGAVACIREIGVDTGGSNVQFAMNPVDGRMTIIEMNPRVSRSSALASKATGYPIAKIAAKLACGYSLDEIPNDITRYTPASFEPTIDYVVVKIPRFAFEKFEGSSPLLTTQMKSVGEAMAIGRTFKEAFQKGLRSLESGRYGWGCDGADLADGEKLRNKTMLLAHIKSLQNDEGRKEEALFKTGTATDKRIFALKDAFYAGHSIEQIHETSKIDPWFLVQMQQIVDMESELMDSGPSMSALRLRVAKKMGFSDKQVAFCWDLSDEETRKIRMKQGIIPSYKLVDTCAAEFKAFTPYYYSTYDEENESECSSRKKVMIIGGGPNRIGQGIEFDYCCVQAAISLKDEGYEVIMVNSNPETVSTDYDTSDKLYFEPLTLEDVLHIYELEQPLGVVVQLGGQTPLNLARALEEHGGKILGTTSQAIHRAEDRDEFNQLLTKLGVRQSESGIARSLADAREIAERIGYPVVVRPSYVLGGRGMEIAYDRLQLERFIKTAAEVSGDHPILIDQYLENAIEVDVDLIGDGENYVIGGILEHIEEAGIHSGDSAMSLPPFSLSQEMKNEISQKTKEIASELQIRGLMNVQYAIKDDELYCLEVNPRASRTIPFISKVIGHPLARYAAQIMMGKKLTDIGFMHEIIPTCTAVKESVFPFIKFPGVDIILSPEMRSTGEVMGIDPDFGMAFFKSQDAASQRLPLEGNVFVSVKNQDKEAVVPIVKDLVAQGYRIISTKGTADYLSAAGVEVETVKKIAEGRPNLIDKIADKQVQLIINTPIGKGPALDEAKIRSVAVSHNIPCITTLNAARASVIALTSFRKTGMRVQALQDYYVPAFDLKTTNP